MKYTIFENMIKDTLNSKKQFEKIDIIIDILYENNYMDFDILKYDNNKISIAGNGIEEYDIEELINNNFKYEIYDNIEDKEYIIEIDEYEFRIKDEINSIFDLNKYNMEINIFDELLNNDVLKYINENYIGMKLSIDYRVKRAWELENILSFQLDCNDTDINELESFRKIIDDEYIDDIEVYYNIDDFLDEYNFNERNFKDYNINIYNEYAIIVNHENKTITNINDVYYFMMETISKYFHDKNNDKIIYYDELIKLYNICTNYEYENEITCENLFMGYLDYSEILEFIINYSEFYFNELNDLFYTTFKKHHLNITESIYDNIRQIKKIELNRNTY